MVRDVNEVSTVSGRRVIPPKPLQAIATRWRLADANWFFDFPESAAHALDFLRESDLYRDASSSIEVVAAVSPGVAKDVLSLLGPISTRTAGAIDAENILMRIQGEVQGARAAKKPAPKEIVGEAAFALIEKLRTLPEKEKGEFFAMLPRWIREGDVKFYSQNAAIQAIVSRYDADGAQFVLPDRFSGDYLSVVLANIGGEKTDLFMKQRVMLESFIDETGVVKNALTIE